MVGRTASVGIVAGAIIAAAIGIFVYVQTAQPPETQTLQPVEKVTLTAILSEPKGRWDLIIDDALQKLRDRHPDMDIQIDYRVLPYAETRRQILTTMAGQTEIDLISVDVIWLGEFAEGRFLTDLTDNVEDWGRSSEWYQENWAGGIYNEKVYGIWAWTDVRALWYWKDLLEEAGADPEALKTWDGYVASSKKVNEVLKNKGIQSMHLVGANHSPDMWYPYLWMLGGDILELSDGHPSKGVYWYPAYHEEEGIKALEFLKRQVDEGIRPQVNHFWGQEFADRKFAVMLEGSWLLGNFPRDQWADIEQQVGMIPIFPVPEEGMETATMMGGWILSIPETSRNKDLAWELLTQMVEPEVLSPMLQEYGYLPTQKPIGEGVYSTQLRLSIPYYDEMIKMLKIGHSRPSIAEYPQIAEHIRHAIDEVYYGEKEPRQALKDAAEKSEKVLGW
ncbi:MAG: extracellular solute-binding protein [Nitrososphaerales archaeon]